MLSNLCNSYSLQGVDQQHAGDDVARTRRKMGWQMEYASLYLLEKVWNVLVVKWQAAA